MCDIYVAIRPKTAKAANASIPLFLVSHLPDACLWVCMVVVVVCGCMLAGFGEVEIEAWGGVVVYMLVAVVLDRRIGRGGWVLSSRWPDRGLIAFFVATELLVGEWESWMEALGHGRKGGFEPIPFPTIQLIEFPQLCPIVVQISSAEPVHPILIRSYFVYVVSQHVHKASSHKSNPPHPSFFFSNIRSRLDSDLCSLSRFLPFISPPSGSAREYSES